MPCRVESRDSSLAVCTDGWQLTEGACYKLLPEVNTLQQAHFGCSSLNSRCVVFYSLAEKWQFGVKHSFLIHFSKVFFFRAVSMITQNVP